MTLFNERLTFDKSKKFNVTEIARKPIEDSRGRFERLFCFDSINKQNMFDVKQVNFSHTNMAGTIRGVHFQLPPANEKKYVICMRGEIFDVIVDLRKGSATYGEYESFILNEQGKTGIIIPNGFGHAFQTLSEGVELLYFHTQPYHADLDSGIDALDEEVGIRWPMPITQRSQKDSELMKLSSFEGIAL